MQPVTRYVTVDGARVAYQVVGDGPVDVVVSAGSFSHTDVIWEDPAAALFYTRLTSFARVIRYDRLGTSNSDPLPPSWEPSLEQYRRELEAVLDAVGAEEIVVIAMLDAGPFAIWYAAAAPERVRKLILYNTSARFLRDDDYDLGMSEAELDEVLVYIDTLWGTDAQVAMNVPSRLGDERFTAWYSKFVRSLGTPTTIIEILQQHLALDARPALGELTIPTLVMHRTGYAVMPLAHGRYLAEHIAGARLLELPGADGPMFWETPDEILAEIRAFVAGDGMPEAATTQVATILFTDIVRSTELAGSLGDREWSAVMGVFEAVAETAVDGSRGRIVKWTGDGLLAVFPDPALGIACAADLRAKLHGMAISVRVGIHTGRVEISHDDVRGLAVHIAARVMAAAGGDQIVVSRTVRDLMLGTDDRFVDLGAHHLKGIDGTWDLYEANPVAR